MSKRLLFIITALLFVSAGAYAQVGSYSSTATDTTGRRLSSPTVKVCSDALCATPVTIYKDAAKTALTNPFTGDAQGNYSFYAAPGSYFAQVAKAGYATLTTPFSIGGDVAQTGNNAFTGSNSHSGKETFGDVLIGAGPFHDPRVEGVVGNGSTDDATNFQTSVNLGPQTFFLKNLSYALSNVTVASDMRFVGSGSSGWNTPNQPTQFVCSGTGPCFTLIPPGGATIQLLEGPTFENLAFRDNGASSGAIKIQSTDHWAVINSSFRDFSTAGDVAIDVDGTGGGLSTDASYGLLFNIRTRNVDTAIRTKQAGTWLGGPSHIVFNKTGWDASDSTNAGIRIFGAKFEHALSNTSALKLNGLSHQVMIFCEPTSGTTGNICLDGQSSLRQSFLVVDSNKGQVAAKIPAGAANNFVDVSACAAVGQCLSDLGDGTLAQSAGNFWYFHSLKFGQRSQWEVRPIKEFTGSFNVETIGAQNGTCYKDGNFSVPIISLTRVSNTVSGVLAYAWPNTTAVNAIIVDGPTGNNGTAFAGTQAVTFSDTTHFTYTEALADDATPSAGTGGILVMVGGSCASVTTPNREFKCVGGRGTTSSAVTAYATALECEDRNAGAFTLYNQTSATAGNTATLTQRFAVDPSGNTTIAAALKLGANSSHIQQNAANVDIAGTIAISAATSASKTFSAAYTSAPACTITPTSDPTAVGVWWVTTSTTAVTANVKTSGTISFTYICVGNPN